jgi:hypothetical protein
MKDGSFSPNIESYTEERYFCESFFGFLSNLAVSFESHSRDKIEKQVDQRIERTIQIYTTKN